MCKRGGGIIVLQREARIELTEILHGILPDKRQMTQIYLFI